MTWLGFLASIIVGLGAGFIGAFANLWAKRIEASLAENDRRKAIKCKIANLAPSTRAFLERFIYESNGFLVYFKNIEAVELEEKGLIKGINTRIGLGCGQIYYVLVDEVAPVLRDILQEEKADEKNCSNKRSTKCCKNIVKALAYLRCFFRKLI